VCCALSAAFGWTASSEKRNPALHMHPRYKTKCIMGLSIGLALVVGGFALGYAELGPRPLAVLLVFGGIPLYLWGCASLARAKGYSLAILVTAVLGLLFPMVVLLALPDKQKHYRRKP
jgi:hypothetical protein